MTRVIYYLAGFTAFMYAIMGLLANFNIGEDVHNTFEVKSLVYFIVAYLADKELKSQDPLAK